MAVCGSVIVMVSLPATLTWGGLLTGTTFEVRPLIPLPRFAFQTPSSSIQTDDSDATAVDFFPA